MWSLNLGLRYMLVGNSENFYQRCLGRGVTMHSTGGLTECIHVLFYYKVYASKKCSVRV